MSSKEHPLYVLHDFEGVVIGNELATELNLPENQPKYHNSPAISTQNNDTAVDEVISGQMNDLSLHTSSSNNQKNMEYDDVRQPQDSLSSSGYSDDQYTVKSPANLAESGIGLASNRNGGSGRGSYGLQTPYPYPYPPPKAPYPSHTPSSPSESYPQTFTSPEASSIPTSPYDYGYSTNSNQQDNHGYKYADLTAYNKYSNNNR